MTKSVTVTPWVLYSKITEMSPLFWRCMCLDIFLHLTQESGSILVPTVALFPTNLWPTHSWMLTPRSLGAVSPVLSIFPTSHKEEEQVTFKLSWIKGENVLQSRYLTLYQGQQLFFMQKCDRVGRQTGWQPLSTYKFGISFPHIRCWRSTMGDKTVSCPATTLLLFGPVSLLCGLKGGSFLFWWVKDLFCWKTVSTIRPTHPWSVLPCFPFT